MSVQQHIIWVVNRPQTHESHSDGRETGSDGWIYLCMLTKTPSEKAQTQVVLSESV